MKNQNNQRRQTILLAASAAIILTASFNAGTFARAPPASRVSPRKRSAARQ